MPDRMWRWRWVGERPPQYGVRANSRGQGETRSPKRMRVSSALQSEPVAATRQDALRSASSRSWSTSRLLSARRRLPGVCRGFAGGWGTARFPGMACMLLQTRGLRGGISMGQFQPGMCGWAFGASRDSAKGASCGWWFERLAGWRLAGGVGMTNLVGEWHGARGKRPRGGAVD